MIKNRRKSNLSAFEKSYFTQKKTTDKSPINCPHDKQNEAKLVLLDMGNDDSIFHAESILCEQSNARNSLLDRMIAHQTKEQSKNTPNNIKTERELHILLPIDSNQNLDFNNFVEERLPQTAGKKQRFSLRNISGLKSKENNFPPRKYLEGKKEQKTILKLKKILKKLQSPQKAKNHVQNDQYQITQSMIKRKKSINKITQFCTQFIYKNNPSKQKTELDFGSRQKLLERQSKQACKFYDFRSGSKTSHQKRRSSLGKVPSSTGTSTPIAFFYKQPSKLTNQNMLFKRSSITTGQLIKQKHYTTGFRNKSGRVNGHASKISASRSQVEDIVFHQQKIKEQRKNRNLKNILFD